MKKILGLLILIIILPVFVFAGTFKNITDRTIDFTPPGESNPFYEQKDVIDPSSWQKVDEEPYTPFAVDDKDIDIPADSTISVSVEINSSTIQIWNLGTTDIYVSANTEDNPYPAVIKEANPNNDADYIRLNNNKTIHTLFFKNLSSTTDGQIKLRVVP